MGLGGGSMGGGSMGGGAGGWEHGGWGWEHGGGAGDGRWEHGGVGAWGWGRVVGRLVIIYGNLNVTTLCQFHGVE